MVLDFEGRAKDRRLAASWTTQADESGQRADERIALSLHDYSHLKRNEQVISDK